MDTTSIISIIISLLVRKEDFNFRPLSFLSALPSRSPLSFGTIRHSRRSPGGIPLISCDNNNDERSGRAAEEGRSKGRAERTRRTTTITGIKTLVGPVRNSRIDRALRMEAGERFESSWSSKSVPSFGLYFALSPLLSRYPVHICRESSALSRSSLHALGPNDVGGSPNRLARLFS